jgi:hypothetical protein
MVSLSRALAGASWLVLVALSSVAGPLGAHAASVDVLPPTLPSRHTRDVTHVNGSSLHRRLDEEDYSCGIGRPCRNGACCGPDGWCGYGPDFCEEGCTSNCDAHAECGVFADPPGKTCPLNVCCSEHGFCGSTTDFCTGLCQSNCVEHPPPPSNAGNGDLVRRVIGYYEAWNANSNCHPMLPSELPRK